MANTTSKRPTVGVRVDPETLAAIDELAEAADVSRCAMAEELLVDALAARNVNVPAVRAEAREGRRLAVKWTGELARIVKDATDMLANGGKPKVVEE